MFYVYILYSKNKDRFYTGQTPDIPARLKRHNEGRVKSTKYGLPWELKWKKGLESRIEAVALERKIKKRGAKRYLIDIGFLKNGV